jgi:hypothetical protein
MNTDKIHTIMGCLDEANVKLSLIDDYLKRFQVRDMRIHAPLLDVHRVLGAILMVVEQEHDKSGEREIAKE